MRLGLSSFIYRYAASPRPDDAAPMDAQTMLRRAYALELDVVQFSDNLPLHRLDAEDLRAVRDLADSLGLGVEVGTRGLDRARLEEYIGLCLFFGSRALRLVLDEPDPERVRTALRWLASLLNEQGLPLAIENHGSIPSRALAELVEALDEPLIGFCVDTANNLILLERPLETVAALAPRARQLHLKDYVVEPARVGYRVTGRVLGQGALDGPAVIAAVRPAERDLDVFLESWMDPADSWGETLLQEERWIAQSVDQARAWLGITPSEDRT